MMILALYHNLGNFHSQKMSKIIFHILQVYLFFTYEYLATCA